MSLKVVAQEEWLTARKALLEKEKAHYRAGDEVSAALRDLPMVKVTKEYTFSGPNDTALTLEDMFDGKKQLIVYHFMFSPESDTGCHGCSLLSDHIPSLTYLRSKDTNMVCVSRAPVPKLDAFKKKMDWHFPWYSSGESDFNYDFHVTFDEARAPILFNYRDVAELEARGRKAAPKGDVHGLSVFLLHEGEVFHTYSTYARGPEFLVNTFALLDRTPLGRQDGPMGPGSYKFKFEYEEDEKDM